MRKLAADPNVEYVEVDQIMRATLTPNDTRFSEQWGFGTSNAGINIRPAWDKATGTGVVVAVIDTGITNHADLNANILPGYDFISDAAMARDGNGRDNNPNDEGDWYGDNECQAGYPGSNSSWHGTHVAGTVAAVTNNSTGVAGTAFNAKVVPVRVLGKCGGYTSDIADAIVWASGGSVSGVPANANPAEVINLSLGGGGSCSTTYQNAINGAVGRGTTVVVAAGNSNTNVSSSVPANCPNVIAVAATTSAGARASFSNYGNGIDISAPGQGILSTLNSGTTTPGSASYASYNGTSMAAPHVAGVVALMQSVAPSPLSPAQVESIIKSTARPLPGACSGGCGAGIIDANAAVAAAINGGGTNPGGNVLQNNVPVTGLGAATGAELNYTVAVPAGSSQLRVAISGGSGDADLYVRQGSAPTDTVYTCRPYLSGNAETCTVNSPAAGRGVFAWGRAVCVPPRRGGCRPWSARRSSNRFEAVRGHVLAHVLRVENPPVHRDVHAARQRLHRTDRAADVELRIRTAETRRAQRAGHHDGLVRDRRQHLAGLHHRIGAVGHQHVPGRLRGDGGADQFAVFIVDVQRILAQDRNHVEAERHAQLAQDHADLGVADLVVRLVVEVDLVDRATGGDDQELFHHVHARNQDRYSGAGPGTQMIRPGGRSVSVACRSGRAALAGWC